MKIRFWGVRGSVPTPGPDTARYGGNTACVSVDVDGRTFIFDAGTGIRLCGTSLLEAGGPVEADIFVSHTHWDHIQGFPFFVPSYIPGNRFTVHGPPSDVQDLAIKQIMELQTRYEYFPVRIAQLGGDITYVDVREGKVPVEGVSMRACRLNHPVACLAYRVEHDGAVFVYGGDHEPFSNLYRDDGADADLDEEFLAELDENAEEQNARIADFCRDADVVVWDGQYTRDEYAAKKGWGHSWHEADLDFAEAAGLRRLVVTHHDPLRSDDALAEMETRLRAEADARGFRLDMAYEGMEIDL